MKSRRIHDRYPVSLDAALSIGDRTMQVRTRNVSIGGAFIEAGEALAFGTPVTIRMRLPSVREETVIESVVRWNEPDGIGLQFLTLRPLDVWGFQQLFKKLDALE